MVVGGERGILQVAATLLEHKHAHVQLTTLSKVQPKERRGARNRKGLVPGKTLEDATVTNVSGIHNKSQLNAAKGCSVYKQSTSVFCDAESTPTDGAISINSIC